MRNMKRFWLLIFVAALGQLTFYGCGKSEEQLVAEREAAKAKAEGERKAQEQKAAAEQIEAAIRMVRESLKDPVSANFKNVRLLRDKPLLICGEVNSRNADGGYGGFTPFVVFKIKEDGVREMYLGKGEPDPSAPANAGIFLLKRCQ
ncbi:MAG: hypothetical protein AAB319_03970 [Pseudomonadota bacterium]